MKILTKLILVFLGTCAALDTPAQELKSNPIIVQALQKLHQATSLSERSPEQESHKTTSLDRRIITEVYYQKQINVETWDSVIFQNYGSRYSELDPMTLEYFADYADPLFQEGMRYAGQKALTYEKTSNSPSYQLIDSTVYKFDRDSNVSFAFSGNGIVEHSYTFEYNSAGQLTTVYYEDNTNSLNSYDTTRYTYGPNYITAKDSWGTDSTVFNSAGQATAIYSHVVDFFYEYDSDGYVDKLRIEQGGSLLATTTLEYIPDYKVYDYNLTYFSQGKITNSEIRTCIGQNGVLDSILYEDFDSIGMTYATYHVDVEEDSYGNIIYWKNYDDSSNIVSWARYDYEDVHTSISEPKPFSQVSIYPNPVSSEMLTISTAENYSSVSLHNLQGQLIMRTMHSPRTESQISLADLPQGSYLLTLESEEGLKSTQSIIKK